MTLHKEVERGPFWFPECYNVLSQAGMQWLIPQPPPSSSCALGCPFLLCFLGLVLPACGGNRELNYTEDHPPVGLPIDNGSIDRVCGSCDKSMVPVTREKSSCSEVHACHSGAG